MLSHLPLDLTTPPALTWLDMLEVGGAGGLRPVAAAIERPLMLASAWAPGFSFIGGQVAITTAAGGSHRFSLAGGGTTPVAALRACLGEAAERCASVARDGDVAVEASVEGMAAHIWTPVRALLDPAVAGTFGWMTVSDADGREAGAVPASWIVRRAHGDALVPPGIAASTGVAAGPDHGFARERAVLELIERDAVALWWRGGRRGRPIAWDAPAADAAAGLLATLREDQQRRATWLLELTTEIGVPVVAAISVDAARGDQFAVGLSARRTQAAAIEGAVLELCQTELAIQLVAGKAAALGAEGLTDADRVTLRRAAAIDADCPLLHPLGAPALAWARPDSDLPAHLAAHGIVTAFVDLTREDTAVPVVRALAPALQSYPGGRVNVRLGAVIEATGGGDALTGGVTLM